MRTLAAPIFLEHFCQQFKYFHEIVGYSVKHLKAHVALVGTLLLVSSLALVTPVEANTPLSWERLLWDKL